MQSMRPQSSDPRGDGGAPAGAPSTLVYPRDAGALPLLPVLLELGRSSGCDRLCVLAPDDLEAASQVALQEAVSAALREATLSPRTTFLIGLPRRDVHRPGRSRLVLDPLLGAAASRPLEALLAPSSRAATVSPRREVHTASGLVVGRLSALLALYKDFLPGSFLTLVQAWLAGRTEPVLATLPVADLERDLLSPARRRLRVVVASD